MLRGLSRGLLCGMGEWHRGRVGEVLQMRLLRADEHRLPRLETLSSFVVARERFGADCPMVELRIRTKFDCPDVPCCGSSPALLHLRDVLPWKTFAGAVLALPLGALVAPLPARELPRGERQFSSAI